MISMVLKVGLLVLLLCSAQVVRAQAGDDLKFEAGGHVTAMRLDRYVAQQPGNVVCVTFPCFAQGREKQTVPGFGGRVGYSFNENVGVEAEMNFFPGDDLAEGGRKIQGLAGIKAGRRFEKVGLFAKARPGFVRFSQGDVGRTPTRPCIAVFPPPAGCFDDPQPVTSFAFDAGAVLELYPGRRTIVRFDAGDTIIRLRERGVLVSPPSGNPQAGVVLLAPAETTHNLQMSVGVGFRF